MAENFTQVGIFHPVTVSNKNKDYVKILNISKDMNRLLRSKPEILEFDQFLQIWKESEYTKFDAEPKDFEGFPDLFVQNYIYKWYTAMYEANPEGKYYLDTNMWINSLVDITQELKISNLISK